MPDYLKGNYKVEAEIKDTAVPEAGATDEFEKKALARLGGSVCFVSKKGFLWKGEDDGAGAEDRAGA
jgi:hypothetical protein